MDTRERIVTECSKMLMSVGPTSMTMDDVARACGISKRTLYETFPDKRTLIEECIHHEHEAKNAALKEIRVRAKKDYGEALWLDNWYTDHPADKPFWKH